MAAVTRVTVTWKDRYAQQAKVVFHVSGSIVDPTDPVILGIVAAIEALCEAKAVKIELSKAASYAGTPGTTAYSSISDKAIFNVLDSDGQAHVVKIPGPPTSIFESDRETIDMANADVDAFVTELTAHFKGRGGNALLGVPSGHRGTSRRLNAL